MEKASLEVMLQIHKVGPLQALMDREEEVKLLKRTLRKFLLHKHILGITCDVCGKLSDLAKEEHVRYEGGECPVKKPG